MLLIASLTNGTDGVHATAILDGVPQGALSFLYGRLPDPAKASVATYTGTGPYVVNLNSAGIWYVWAKDDTGVSSDYQAVVVGGTDNIAFNEMGEYLAGLLQTHQRGIEAVLHQYDPNTTIKQILYGNPSDVNAWPAIVISDQMQFRDNYLATEYVRDYQLFITIFCIVVHNDEATEVRLGARLAGAVAMVLNNPTYESLTLPSGFTTGFGHCTAGSLRSVRAGDRFSQAATLQWSCRTSIGGRP